MGRILARVYELALRRLIGNIRTSPENFAAALIE